MNTDLAITVESYLSLVASSDPSQVSLKLLQRKLEEAGAWDQVERERYLNEFKNGLLQVIDEYLEIQPPNSEIRVFLMIMRKIVERSPQERKKLQSGNLDLARKIQKLLSAESPVLSELKT